MFPRDPYGNLVPFPTLWSRAILNGDVDQVRLLIERSRTVNCRDNNANAPLHLAVQEQREEILILLLSCPGVNVDQKNSFGYTPLLLGLRKWIPHCYIMHLLEGNCNLHLTNNRKQTALHLAIIGSRYGEKLLCELIKRGADVNAQDDDDMTPLHYAARYCNEAAIHVLLYYEADVNLFCRENKTAFMYAAESSYNISRILFDFYDFSYSSEHYNSLLLAAESRNPIVFDLVRTCTDVSVLICGSYPITLCSLWYSNAELFKEVWQKLDLQKIINGTETFFHNFVYFCMFSNSEFLECLYLMLNSSCVTDLLNPPIPPDSLGMYDCSLKLLIESFHKRMIPKSPRLDIIRIILSYGYQVHFKDLKAAYKRYGIDEELEILIQAGHCNKQSNCRCNSRYNPPLLTFILGLEEDCRSEQIFTIFRSEICSYSDQDADKTVVKNNILYALRLFSIPFLEKQKLIKLCLKYEIDDVLEELTAVSELPSLAEIGRNQARKYIRQKYKIVQQYHFYDVLKMLNIPYTIRDILTFKKPLYT